MGQKERLQNCRVPCEAVNRQTLPVHSAGCHGQRAQRVGHVLGCVSPAQEKTWPTAQEYLLRWPWHPTSWTGWGAGPLGVTIAPATRTLRDSAGGLDRHVARGARPKQISDRFPADSSQWGI